MQYSTNYNMNKPELSEQYRLNHWNDNTDIIDTELKRNADDISSETSRASDAENALRNISDSNFKNALLNFCYPVGSLYWSSKSTDPSTLFGGTWVQIKDRFVLACGDTYASSGATGGASSVTLSVSNMPSHSHSFTPSGTISMNAHSHGLNNHTHNFSGTTGSMNGNSSGSFNARRSDVLGASATVDCSGIVTRGDLFPAFRSDSGEFSKGGVNYSININHNHSFSGTTNGNSGDTTPTTSTGSFSGTQGTTSPEGSGTSFSILPPYVVKYCWERTA